MIITTFLDHIALLHARGEDRLDLWLSIDMGWVGLDCRFGVWVMSTGGVSNAASVQLLSSGGHGVYSPAEE